MELILTLIVIMMTVVLLLLLLRRWLKPVVITFGNPEGQKIQDPQEIKAIIQRSADLRSIYDFEILSRGYKGTYKGLILGIGPDGLIDVELTSFINPELTFVEKAAFVAFRMSRLGKQEFFQFDTTTRGIQYTKNYGRKEKVVRMDLPHQLRIGQKRRHVRIQPKGRHRIKGNLVTTDEKMDGLPINSFRRIHLGEIIDLSVGGLMLRTEARGMDMNIQAGQEVFIQFRLPLEGLEIKNGPPLQMMKVAIVSVERQMTGQRVMSREAEKTAKGVYHIRLRYTGKCLINRKKGVIQVMPLTSMSFEDLATWLQAYQRYQIRREKGLASKVDRPQNAYGRKPLEIKPKYPTKPLAREPRG